MNRIVLAHSGSPGAASVVPWLGDRYGAEVVTVTLELGQGADLEAARDRALAAGAVRAHVLDARDAFARTYVLPTLQAGAIAELASARDASGSDSPDRSECPPAGALSRAIVGQLLVDIARLEQADAIAHAGSARLARVLESLLPPDGNVAVLSLRNSGSSTERVDSNLWGRTVDCGTDGEASAATETDYKLTRSLSDCPTEPAFVQIAFERGVPTAVNGIAMPLVDLVASLTLIAGAHGIGRFETVDRRPDDAQAPAMRQICEAPAAALLHAAHATLRRAVRADQPAALAHVARQYADLVSGGLWFTPLRAALDASVSRVQEHVTGEVRIKLFKGHHTIHDDALVRTV